MRIYKLFNMIVRVTISDGNNVLKLSIAESTCEQVCDLTTNIFASHVITSKSKGVGKLRAVSVRIDELDNKTDRMRKVSRTISLKDITINETHERLLDAVNECERQSIIERAKEYTND